MKVYEATAVCTGRAIGVPIESFTWGEVSGFTVTSPHIMWVLRDENGTTTIVDTGAGPTDDVNEFHRPFERTELEVPEAALASAGVDPGHVRTVVLSHLHYDHCGNNHLFPNATFIVHRAEIGYALAPHPVHAQVYEAPTIGMTPRWISAMDRIVEVDGDVDLDEGMRLVHLPGHTPGLLGMVVMTPGGLLGLPSDHCARYENWEGAGALEEIPSRTYVDLDEYYASFRKLRSLTADIAPSHDPRVVEKFGWQPG